MRLRGIIDAVRMFYALGHTSLEDSPHIRRGTSHMLMPTAWGEYLSQQYVARHPTVLNGKVRRGVLRYLRTGCKFRKCDGPSRAGVYCNQLEKFARKLRFKDRWRGKKYAKAVRRFERVAKAHPHYQDILKFAKAFNDPKSWKTVDEATKDYVPTPAEPAASVVSEYPDDYLCPPGRSTM